MKEQKIVWTVLPNGTAKTGSGDPGLKLSVFVSPRLYTDGGSSEPHLDQFPDFLNWPEKVKAMTFNVEFDNGTTIPAIPDKTNFDADLWKALFKPTTYVRPHTFKDFKERGIRTFPVQDVLHYIKKKYVTIAEKSPGSLPLLTPRRDDEGKIIDDPDSTLESLIDDLGDLLKPEKKTICTIKEEYKKFREVLFHEDSNQAVKILLPYISQCLSKKGLPFSYDKARIAKADDDLWVITDGENVCYVEDTGDALNIFQYTSIYSKIDKELEASKVLDPDKLYGYTKEQIDFLQVNRFYDREEISNPYYFRPNAKMTRPPPEIPKIDFHQMLATLGDHPSLMRKLALVLDFLIPVPEKPFTAIRISPVWNVDDPPFSYHMNLPNPWTKCIFVSHRFLAMPKPGSKLQDRMLNLKGASDEHNGSNTVYNLVQVDPDGASLQMINSTSTMSRQLKRKYLYTLPKDLSKGVLTDCKLNLSQFNSIIKDIKELDPDDFSISGEATISKIASNKWVLSDKDKTYELEYTGNATMHIYEKMDVAYDMPDDAGLPSLRSAGIALTKSRRAFDLNKHFLASFTINQDFESSTPVVLYADDLVRGYRVDILNTDTDDPEWRSLCRRVGTYSFPGTGVDKINVGEDDDDEGYVKGGSTSSSDAQDSDLYFHETVFRWNGWSLCAQRPGRTIITESSKEEIYLFNWKNTPADNTELTHFLEDYLNARWVRKAHIEKPDDNTIIISDPEHSITLILEGDGTVTLTTDTGKGYTYVSKAENADVNIYTVIEKQEEKPGLVKNEAVTEFKLEPVFNATPGSLPKLRFGHTYRLRARIVDLAGNSESWESPDGSLASETIHYVRYEPLLPPTLVPRTPFTEGEAVERMVIRSNFDVTASQYVESEAVQNALQGEKHSYVEGNERHVVPPKTSQLTAETHGEFDEFFGSGKNYTKGYNIALKEEGTLFDTEIVNTATGEKELIPNHELVEIIKPPVTGTPEEEAPGQYVIHGEEALQLPYLPDPISQGTSLSDLPGLSSSATSGLVKIIDPTLGLNILKIPFDLEWPDSKPFRIRIEERPGQMTEASCEETFQHIEAPPKWDQVNRILTVYLAKAQEAKVRYSCYFNHDDLSKMGIWKWLNNSSLKHTLTKYALAGSHWMFTPYRELVLVHAVQQPLCEPQISLLKSIKNNIGDSYTTVTGEIHLSSKSTDKLDLLANWIEPVDDLAEDEPGTIDVNANAFELKISDMDNNTIDLPVKPCVDHLHEFGDTKYRHVKYYFVGTTRFREYFHTNLTEPETCCFDWDKIPGEDNKKIVDFLNKNRQLDFTLAATIIKSVDGQTVTVEEAGTAITLTLNEDRNAINVNDNGKEYIYTIVANANTELCINVGRITRRSAVYETDVLNSARPASPKVQYIIPTFGWEEKKEPHNAEKWRTFTRKRSGGGLRVYMDRPWYSSGDGELLGVILYPHAVPDTLKPYVTQWGMDPIRQSTVPKGILSIHDFTGIEKSQEDLSLDELGPANQTFDVVGFKPEYNKDRKLWYCDIQFDPEKIISYYPFVRLALASYQPNSIPQAHLSRVVLTDFVQLANDRTLFIEFIDENTVYISVTGYGTGDRSSNRVEVTIEELPPGAHEEFGWNPIKGSKTQPNPYTLHLKPVDIKTYLWKWDAKLQLPRLPKNTTYRLVVKEYEKYKADKEVKVFSITHVAPVEYTYDTQDTERLVYTDVVDLTRMR
jgi:hypothetical protein